MDLNNGWADMGNGYINIPMTLTYSFTPNGHQEVSGSVPLSNIISALQAGFVGATFEYTGDDVPDLVRENKRPNTFKDKLLAKSKKRRHK